MAFMRYIGVDYSGAQTPTASLKGLRFHFWPFDDWKIPADCSVVAEVYPALWRQEFEREDRTGDQHDACSIAAWLSRADHEGTLAAFFEPDLSPKEQAMARVEGWILGIA
jgi:hypothetical protein